MDTGPFLLFLLITLGLLLPFLIFLIRTLNNILPYLYINARISAKWARLVKNETLDEMINSGSVAEVASILENTEYSLAMQGLVMESSESIERLLTHQTADVYDEITSMLPANMHRVFRYLRQQWDVYNLKIILRGLRHGLTTDDITGKLIPFGELEMDFLRKLAESGSVQDVLPLFEETDYEQLAALLPVYEERLSLLPLETALDKQLYENMWQAVCSQAELQVLKPGLGARIDVLNMKTLFRAKRDHLQLNDIQEYIIEAGEAHSGIVKVFEEVDDIGGLLPELEDTEFYRPLMEALPEYEKSGSLFCFEKALDETALSRGKQTAVTHPYGVAPLLGYLSWKDTEVRNIRAIARAKETGMQPDQIRRLVLVSLSGMV